jgi:hypothetical protein
MDKQLEIWGDYYNNHNMRHLFIESPYFTAQFLNMWMQADDDTILNQLYSVWEGTLKHTPHTLAFYQTIKRDYPETIFHGTDVGHQSDTTGQRFLHHLIDNDLKDTEQYTLTRENIAQFERYQRSRSHAIRAHYKPLNFIREFDALIDQDVMAIHGWSHVDLTDNFAGLGVPSMATILKEHYGDALQTFNMRHYYFIIEPYRSDTITIDGTEFKVSYFGNDGVRFVNGLGQQIVGREFWRLEDAYEHFKDSHLTGIVLPFDNYPMPIEVGQVFVMDIHFADNTVERQFFRASGHYWNNRPSTQEFIP